MNDYGKIVNKIIKDCGKDSLEFKLFIELSKFTSLDYVTLAMVRSLSCESISVKEAERIMRYFSGESIGLFNLRYSLIGDEDMGEEDIEILTEYMDMYHNSGEKVYNPDTGEEIRDVEGSVFIFFSSTSLLKEIIKEVNNPTYFFLKRLFPEKVFGGKK